MKRALIIIAIGLAAPAQIAAEDSPLPAPSPAREATVCNTFKKITKTFILKEPHSAPDLMWAINFLHPTGGINLLAPPPELSSTDSRIHGNGLTAIFSNSCSLSIATAPAPENNRARLNIPEPAVSSLCMSAFVGLIGRRRRK